VDGEWGTRDFLKGPEHTAFTSNSAGAIQRRRGEKVVFLHGCTNTSHCLAGHRRGPRLGSVPSLSTQHGRVPHCCIDTCATST